MEGVFRRLDDRVEKLEVAFGPSRLIQAIAALDLDRVNGHVDRYRRIIRAGGWPNELYPSDFAEFITDFETACSVYADVAFISLDHYVRGHFDPDMVLRLAVGSEALRGQYGKQSPTGLDARLAEIEEFLFATLAPVADEDADELLIQLCTPANGPSPAELAMLEDFRELRKTTPRPSDIEEIEFDSPGTGRLRSFLRHHCRWSLARLQQVYEQLDDALLDERVDQVRERRRANAGGQQQAKIAVSNLLPERTASLVLEAAARARVLNGLNLAVEPVFSFKGGLGLAHGLIFDRCDGRPPNIVAADDMREMKWRLLNNTRNRPEEGNR